MPPVCEAPGTCRMSSEITVKLVPAVAPKVREQLARSCFSMRLPEPVHLALDVGLAGGPANEHGVAADGHHE